MMMLEDRKWWAMLGTAAAGLGLMLGLLLGQVALAQPAAACSQPHELDKYQLLRRLSLDLRNKVPSVAEYEALDSQPTVPMSTITSWMTGDDFRLAMRRYHEDMFWPNVSNVQFQNVASSISPTGTQQAFRLAGVNRRRTYRVDPDNTTALGIDCGDFQATVSGPNKTPTDIREVKNAVGTVTQRQEGWRLVEPYWAPGTQVRVCAYEAQETLEVDVGGTPTSCADPAAHGNRNCGCGPNLRFCYGPNAQVAAVIQRDLREQLNRSVDQVTVGGKPYTDLLLSRTAESSGPIVFWKQFLSNNYSLSRVYTVPDDAEQPPPDAAPARAFNDATWQATTRGAMHAGVLTLPAYLLKFQTNRARANRARIDFECASFVPPTTLEDPATATPACTTSGTDLTKRCTCRYCHNLLEPMAGHFGQFAEAGTTLMSTAKFPRTRANCVGSNNGICNRFYVTEASEPNAGALLPYQYADTATPTHTQIRDALASGPRGYANGIINNKTFAKCTVKRTFQFLVKRELRALPPQTDELALLNTLSQGFEASGYDYRALVESIVSLPQYRRVR